MDFKNKLKIARIQQNLTQKDVINQLHEYGYNISRATISRWESGIYTPRFDLLKILSKIYNIPLIELIDPKPDIETEEVTSDTLLLPILGEVSAGTGAYADNEIEGYESLPADWVADENEVLLKVKGDSMYPKFEDGDLLLIHPQETLESGEYGVFLIDGDNGVVKRLLTGSNWIELTSVNPNYPPRRFVDKNMNRVRIFGKVKKQIRNV